MTRKNKSRALVYKSPQSRVDMPSYLSSQVNPFDPLAQGSKIHDANSARTFTFQSREVKSLGVNSVGAAAAQVYPFLADNMTHANSATTDVGATGTTTGSPTFIDTSVPEYSDITSSANQFRIVSWGIRVTCDESAQLAKGRLFIMEHTGNQMNSSTDLSRLSDNYVLLPITHDMDYMVIPNHVNETYQEFIDVDLNISTYRSAFEQSFPWRSILFLALGAASTTKLNLEIVYNLELIPSIGSMGARLATAAAPHSHEILERVHNTRNALPLAHKTKSLWQKIKDVAKKSLVSVGEYALDRITGGASKFIEDGVNKFVTRPSQLFITN